MKTKWLILALSFLMLCSCDLPNKPVPIEHFFSVGKGKIIQFSPGFLQYDTLNHEYHFAQSQLEAAHHEVFGQNRIDYFVWGHGENPFFNSDLREDYEVFNDWGNYPIDEYPKDSWRTLSAEEWSFLLEQRPNANDLIGLARVDTIDGYFLLPTNWTDVRDVPLVKGLHPDPMYERDVFQEKNLLTLSQWKKLEAAGAVFLPIANGSLLPSVEIWTNEKMWDGWNFFLISIVLYPHSSSIKAHQYGSRNRCPVRLVRDFPATKK